MMTKHEARVTKDAAGKKIKVVKELDAPIEQVWKAWTDSKLLDKWWAPKPWRTETKKMDFKEGGSWLYSMVGPNDERHYARVDYLKIDAPNKFTSTDSFSDENGNKTGDLPSMKWDTNFAKTGDGTKVEVNITFQNEEDMEKILEMGFEEGFKMGLDNLEELLAK